MKIPVKLLVISLVNIIFASYAIVYYLPYLIQLATLDGNQFIKFIFYSRVILFTAVILAIILACLKQSWARIIYCFCSILKLPMVYLVVGSNSITFFLEIMIFVISAVILFHPKVSEYCNN